MRTALVCVGLSGLMAGCGDDAGAILLLSAPDGPGGAARLEIVLANAAEDTIARDIDQRIAPDSLDEEPVTYFRQRASGGNAMGVDVLDGFSVRIEPELSVVEDVEFVPFLLVRNEQDEVIAVGTVDDDDGKPYPIDILTTDRVEYVTTVRPVTNPAAKHGLNAIGQTVRCTSPRGDSFTSGVVWRPENGPELRLLLADRSVDANATDASDRELDLDCDQVAADSDDARDCDDVRAAIHAGAVETCDGIDADCDGSEAKVLPCQLEQAIDCDADVGNPASVTDGVQACVEGDNASPPRTTACVAGATCACPNGSCFARRCTVGVSTVTGDVYSLCSPATALLSVCNGDPSCSVSIQDVNSDHHVSISGVEGGAGPYGDTSTGVKTYVRFEQQGGPIATVPGNGPQDLGSVVLAIDTPATNSVRAYVLRFVANDDLGCNTGGPGQSAAMSCQP